ncbi:MAG: sulfur carrier protein ThiS [Planctomycetaceae bacterium]|nr:sulfur carrier protein ThiS [Planctomycetaceae bacterium]
MSITLNGEPRQVPATTTIVDLLVELKVESRYCAVERNRDLVPREQHAACVLMSGDEVEVVTLVGGG